MRPLYRAAGCRQRNKRWQRQEREAEYYFGSIMNRSLASITRDEIERLHILIGKRAPVQANRAMSLLRAVYNHAIKKGWQGTNPVVGLDYNRETSRDRFVMPDEMPFLLYALEKEPRETMRDFFMTLLLTGARKGNVQNMRWEQIEWRFECWHIPDTKNGQPLTLPLTPEAMEILHRRKQSAKGPWVFSQRGNSTKPINNP